MFRRVFIAALTATLLQNACTAHGAAVEPARDEAPLDIAISTILKDPWRHHGKLVRVRGTFDECAVYTCRICEDADSAKRSEDGRKICMGASFREDKKLEPAGGEEHLDLMRERALELIERNVRFATVTLVARYDALCSGVRQPSLPDDSDDVICLHRASQLKDALITTAHIRRPATAGPITRYFDEALAGPGKEDTNALDAAFRAALSAASAPDDVKKPGFVFLDETSPELREKYGIEATGGACICLLKDCSGIQWPKRVGDVYFDIPANPYKCWWAEKVGGVWKFPLQ